MPEPLALSLVIALAAYAGVGLVVALVFVARGLERVDPAARGAGWALRALLLPGLCAMWPWVIARWRGAARARGGGTP